MPTIGMPGRRQLLASVLFGLLILGGFAWPFLGLLAVDRGRLQRDQAGIPDRPDPAFAAFLESVRTKTEPSSSIAILFPARSWDDGYAWAYYRAWYRLADRRVLPLLWRQGEILIDNLAAADFVVAWRTPNAQIPGFVTIWRSGEGTLLRRARGNGNGEPR